MKKIMTEIKFINIFLFIFIFLNVVTSFFNKTIVNHKKEYLMSKTDFFNMIAPLAVEDMKETGVYASVTIGQAIEESGWGSSKLSSVYNAYFGMSGGSCSSSGQIRQTSNSNQFWSGMEVCMCSERRCAWRRIYDSVANSVKDHSRNLWCISDGRYVKNGVFEATSSSQQIYAIAASGYAASPSNYYNNVYNKLIVSNNLTKYDVGYKKIKPAYAETCTDATYSGVMPNISGIQSGNNAINIFTTTYEGNIREGYIYARQKGNALIINKKDTDEAISDKVDNIINKIFNNAGRYSSGTANSGNYELVVPEGSRNALDWKQYDSNWGSIKLGSKGQTIKGVGCLATSVAIQIKLSGTQINSDNFNPGTWVQYLNGHNGFSGSLFNWSNSGWSGLVPNWEIVDSKVNLPSSKEGKLSTINSYLEQGYYPIMCVKKNCGHWVAVTGVTSDNIKIVDPGSTATTAWPKYEVSNTTRIAIFKKND